MSERHSVKVRRLKAVTVFKLTYVTSAAIFFPFSLLMGILAVFGAPTVKVSVRPSLGSWACCTAF